MFGKKKKEPKVEQVFQNQNNENESSEIKTENENSKAVESNPDQQPQANEEQKLTEAQKEKLEKIDIVKDKISKILQSSNIEIVDENVGDEFEDVTDSDLKKQQDYDSLKAIFGSENKGKKQELTLTIDDFDYTYTGKYVDEYDLIHLKNIKRIKLQKKHSKITKRLIIAASVILVIGLAIALTIIFTRKTPVYLTSIALSETEQEYYVNSVFEYDGIYILATYSNGEVKEIKLDKSHFVATAGYVDPGNDELLFYASGDVTIYFGYGGLQTSIKITIKEKNVEEIYADYSPGLVNLKNGDYITNEDLYVYAKYSNFDYDEEIDFSLLKLSVNGVELKKGNDEKTGKYGFKLNTDLNESVVIEISYDIQVNGQTKSFKTSINFQ